MATIGKIREKSGLLLITVGLAMLAFILTDLFKPSGNYEQEPLGTIYGEPIDAGAYQRLLDIEMDNEMAALAQQNREMTPEDVENVRNRVWNNFIRETLLSREFEKLGIVTNVDELNAFIVGDFTHDQLKQMPFFQDAMGAFSKDSLLGFVNQLNSGNMPVEVIEWWSGVEKFVKEDRQVRKYLTLIEKGIYVTEAEAEHQYNAETTVKKIEFVLKRYNNIPDDEVEISDKDIKAYYEEHKNEKKYEQEDAVEIKFVSFPIIPGEEDQFAFNERIQEMKERFKKTENDSLFVMNNAETPNFQPGKKFRSGEYPKDLDEAVQNAQEGDIIGPYNENGKIKLAKVVSNSLEEQATVRHILLSTADGQDTIAVKRTADSLVKVIRANKNFEEMVTQFSEDPGSVETGGVYEWFPKGMMVPPFEEAAFNGAFNQLQVVRTSYGYHIVEPLARREGNAPVLAIVDKSVTPLESTIQSVNEKALDFMYVAADAKNFDSLATDSGYVVRSAKVNINQISIPGIERPHQIMRWAFNQNTKAGEVSEPFKVDNNFVVAKLERKIEEGVPSFEDVKEAMRAPAIKQKKAKIYMAKMKGKTLNDIASAVGESVLFADVKFSSNSIAGGGGNEPKVIGTIFSIDQDGVMTKAIEGETGIYVVKISSTVPGPATTDYSVQKEQMTSSRRSTASSGVYQALYERADVKDNRKKNEYKY